MFDCGDGIYGIDTFYEREGCTSVYIICSGGRCGIIESAANSSLPHLLSALDELGVDYANVDFLALTHVHLDHAGGAGSYMQKFPNAKLIVHPRGAKHMADPTALIEGVCEVYGKSETERMYGEIIPIDRRLLYTLALIYLSWFLMIFDPPDGSQHLLLCGWQSLRSRVSGADS